MPVVRIAGHVKVSGAATVKLRARGFDKLTAGPGRRHQFKKIGPLTWNSLPAARHGSAACPTLLRTHCARPRPARARPTWSNPRIHVQLPARRDHAAADGAAPTFDLSVGVGIAHFSELVASFRQFTPTSSVFWAKLRLRSRSMRCCCFECRRVLGRLFIAGRDQHAAREWVAVANKREKPREIGCPHVRKGLPVSGSRYGKTCGGEPVRISSNNGAWGHRGGWRKRLMKAWKSCSRRPRQPTDRRRRGDARNC